MPLYILQVLQGTSTTESSAITVGNFVDAVSQAITPSSTNSKILIRCAVAASGNTNAYGHGTLLRDSTKENDPARKCILVEIPEIIFIFLAIPLLLLSFKSFESVLRIFSNLSNFKCQSEITNQKSANFPDSYFLK